MSIKSNVVLYDSRGNPVDSPAQKLKSSVSPNIQKNAFGLYGNIFSYPNAGQYRPRFYTLSDTEQGLDSLSRELLVRWSREITAQQPWIGSAIRLLAQYSVGNAYTPVYTGANEAWGKIAVDWLLQEFYPNCCTRGRAYDFQNMLYLESCMLDQDGDLLCIYGKDENSAPKVQIIPSHRIGSPKNGLKITEGPFAGYQMSDGVIYTQDGRAIGYNISNATNLQNSIFDSKTDYKISAKHCHLLYDTRFFDKSRGVPSVGSGILQALSIQELDSYLTERIKIESTVALIEKNEAGEAPYQLQQTLAALENSTSNAGYGVNPQLGGLRVVQGADIRYVKASGGDIKSLQSNTPGIETSNYIKRLETQILSALGVPHQLLFSPENVSGRITSGIVEIFKSSVTRRQKILDKHAKFIINWAVSVAIEQKIIPPNDSENLNNVFTVTHPKEFSLDEGYNRKADLDDLAAGVKTLDDVVRKRNTTAKEVICKKAEEAKEFFRKAQEVSAETGVDVNTVLTYMKNDLNIAIRSSENPDEQKSNESPNQ